MSKIAIFYLLIIFMVLPGISFSQTIMLPLKENKQPSGMMLIAVDPLQKIFPEVNLFPDLKATADVARGEHATFQFAFRSVLPVEHLTASVTQLNQKYSLINHQTVIIGYVDYVRMGKTISIPPPDKLISSSGFFPDPIIDTSYIEPGREDFCMLGVANEAMGAHALGLERHNLNMLRRIVENISDSRDWCSLWEINRYNLPAPVAYKNEAEFWYNLPANFEIIDLCYRMYVWTGDRTYVDDQVFLNFYDRTVTDYEERWGLGIDQIMKRPRLLNIRGMVDPDNRFQKYHGIPGYNESESEYVLGVDVLQHRLS